VLQQLAARLQQLLQLLLLPAAACQRTGHGCRCRM
jgi:hypothetical protein